LQWGGKIGLNLGYSMGQVGVDLVQEQWK
jgi:hypothetical protein